MSESDTNRDIDETSQDSAEEVPRREPPKPLEPALVIDRRPRFSDNRPVRSGWTTAVACLCGVVALGLLLNFILEFRRGAVLDAIVEDADKAVQIADSDAEQDAVARANQTRMESVSASKVRFNRVRRNLNETENALAGLREKEEQVASLRGELFSGDVGPKVATDVSLIDRVIAQVDELDDDTSSTASEIAADFAAAASPILDADTVPADYEPSADLKRIIADINQDIRTRDRFLDRVVRTLSGLIGDADGLETAARVSLADAITARRDERARAILDREQRRTNEEAKRIAKERADRKIDEMKRIAAAEAEVQRRKMQELVAARNREAEESQRRSELAKLESEFQRDLPTIRTHLASLLSDGVKLRGGNAGVGKGPVSLASLEGMGATDSTNAGLKAFATSLAPSVNDRSDRVSYKWADMAKFTSIENWHQHFDDGFAREGHRLLMKYGPLLVEKGLLAP